jgi:hypothetical protein
MPFWYTCRMTGEAQSELWAMRERSFERIKIEALRYAESDHALAIYVQDTLFDWSRAQQTTAQDLAKRAELSAADPECVILFPDELHELRLRAAYHGAGLATESRDNIPDAVLFRLFDNLENFSPQMVYEQMVMPWMYRIDKGSLRAIISHDYSIAARDDADGDLHRLCTENEGDFDGLMS